MRKQTLAIFVICSLLIAGNITSCNKDDKSNKIENSQNHEGTTEEEEEKDVEELIPPKPSSDEYSYLPDGAEIINGDDPTKVRIILNSLTSNTKQQSASLLSQTSGDNPLLSLYYDDVTQAELEEIKALSDEIVKNQKTEYDKYNSIFKWIVNNIKYGWVHSENGIDSNRPSQVLKNRKCVCQGYANLLKVMCYTQNIQAIVASGGCYHNGRWLGEHAWNYVYVNEHWIVSDPTWHRQFDMKNDFKKHKELLKASRLVTRLYHNNDFNIGYKNSELTVTELYNSRPKNKTIAKRSFIPYSWKKFRVTSFDPDKPIPSIIQELVLGENIISFGNIIGNSSGLINSNYGKDIKKIFIVPNNPKYEAIDGIIYDKTVEKSNRWPVFIMDYVVDVNVMYGEYFGKNVIVNKPNLKSIYFPDSSKDIEDYAVENCPKLTRVSLPKNCKTSKNAFYNCNPALKINIR